MIHALAASLIAALLLRFLSRASRPGMVLDFLGEQWQTWLISRPVWLSAKASGDCALCTSWWVPGLPVAVLVGCCFTTWWALAVPFLIASATDFLLSK